MIGRKLNIGRLSLWIEDGKPRFAGVESLDAARGQAREVLVRIEEWLAAEERPAVKHAPLSQAQQNAVKRLIKKLHVTPQFGNPPLGALT